MNRRILVVAAHSDDEALGCGGTLARHVAEDDRVEAIFVADGVSSRKEGADKGVVRREHAAARAQSILGIHAVHHLKLPDNRLDTLALLDIVQSIEPLIRSIAPEVIYTHHHGDLNVDHRLVHEAVLTACRPQPGCSVREIYTFEVMSSSEWNTPGKHPFLPQMRVDISAQLPRKLEALKAYGEEMRCAPHSRSIEHLQALAVHRGHEAGLMAAEAFGVIRLLR